MKWFKHHCDLTRNEQVADFLYGCGRSRLEGYGFLCRLAELIAERMEADRPQARPYPSDRGVVTSTRLSPPHGQ